MGPLHQAPQNLLEREVSTLPLFLSHHLQARVGPVYLNSVFPSQIQSYFFNSFRKSPQSQHSFSLRKLPHPQLASFHTEKLLLLPLNLATTTSLCSQKPREIESIKLEGTERPPPTAMSQVQRKLPLLTMLPAAPTSFSLRSFI